MSSKNRRAFLKSAGVGAALTAVPLGLAAQAPQTAAQTASFDVTRFGAKGNGSDLDTTAVNDAIEAAAKAGGGTVSFPAGSYLCHSIHFRSNVGLYLGQGATPSWPPTRPPIGTGAGYDPAEPNAPWESYQDFGHNHWHNSLIWGEGLHDVAISARA